MSLKLNIWKNKSEIEKTLETDEDDILWGTVEDIIEKIDLETFFDVGDGNIIFELGKKITKALGCVKPLLLDIFPELTEEELRRCKAKEIRDVVIKIVKYSCGNFVEMGDENEGN